MSPSAQLREVLSECDVFRTLQPVLVDAIFDCMEERRFAADERLIRQGDPGDCLYLIVEGETRAEVHDGDGPAFPVGRFTRGDFVGEMALLTQEPRTADVVARSDVRVLSLSAADFDRLVARDPELGVVLTNLLADRLGQTVRDGLGGKVVGGHRILRRLGRGGMGVVYEAVEIESGRHVALKMMSHGLIYHWGASARFRQEAEVVRHLQHDRIARLFTQFSAYKTHFLAMELCDGPTLTQLVRQHGALPEEQVRRILGQLAGALIYIHGQGVVHRDLKPGNVMINLDGRLKLTDFGLAKQGPLFGDATTTLPNTLLGSPPYMAPEQLAGQTSDARTDIYALACMTYELLAGRRLFKGTNLVELIEERIRLTLPPAAEIAGGISSELHEMIRTGLKREPSERRVALAPLERWAAPLDTALLAGS